MTRPAFAPATQTALAAFHEGRRALNEAIDAELKEPAGLERGFALAAIAVGFALTLKRFVAAHGPELDVALLAAE